MMQLILDLGGQDSSVEIQKCMRFIALFVLRHVIEIIKSHYLNQYPIRQSYKTKMRTAPFMKKENNYSLFQ